MYTHFIIMGSSYSEGKRIAIDYIVPQVSVEFIKSQITKIKETVGNLHCISTRMITASGEAWNCVAEADSFFEKVLLYNDIDKFIDALKSNLQLSSIDVAEYILSKLEESEHLKLQKLAYLSHADYLEKTQQPLFSDKVCAFHNGPICYDTYKILKSKGYWKYDIVKKTMDIETARSRILSSYDGAKKMKSIDLTLEKYRQFTSDELVNITHKDNSPWDKCYVPMKRYTPIPNKTIIEFHKYEA
ncbi:MAG: Panacea domain-containing protein [Oscillospiraceae bacterium]